MKDEKPLAEAADVRQAWINFKTALAAMLFDLGYRLLGATRDHAWDAARVAVANAVLDKTVEKTGIRDPRQIDPMMMQVTFEGGPLDGSIRHVSILAQMIQVAPKPESLSIAGRGLPILPQPDTKLHRYLRTDRTRVDSVIFVYAGFR